MKWKTLEKDKVHVLVKELSKEHDVFAPVGKKNRIAFEKVSSGDEICLEFQNTKKPPKEILLPQTEILFTFRTSKKSVEINKPRAASKEKLLLGVRPCDARSFVLLDKFFSSGENKDSHYLQKRKDTTIIGLSCNHPLRTCFCTSVGGSPYGKEGMDLLLLNLDDKYMIEAITEKGNKLVENLRWLKEAEKEDVDKAKKLSEDAEKSMKSKVPVEGLCKKLDGMFDDPLWEEMRKKCVNCGVCSYLCPTCCCFDILDEETDEGKRVRIWDSCQFPFFTLQGSGYNPRASGKEMVRQRIMHKFSYYVKNFGESLCVGCGRCVKECPVNIDIREVIDEISARQAK